MRRFLLLTLAACSPSGLSPFGHVELEAHGDALRGLAEPLSVHVGRVAAYDVARSGDDGVRFTVQGHPAGGRQSIEVTGHGVTVQAGFIDYALAERRVVAFGASLSMGTQDASVGRHSQLNGPSALIAKQLGAYLGLPLVKPGFLPKIEVSDIDPVTCALPEDVFATVGQRAQATLLPKLTDAQGNIVLSRVREDPDLVATDVAIGGETVPAVVGHPHDVMGVLLEHIAWDPRAPADALVNPPLSSQLDRVAELAPTLLFSFDLIVNDYNNVNLDTDGIPDLSAVTSDEAFRTALERVLAVTDATGADVFLATGPDSTLLPRYDAKVAKLKAAGYSDADATGWRTQLSQRVDQLNALLLDEASTHPRIHVVDLHQRIGEIWGTGVDVGGEHLTTAPLHGLLSLDGMHFSDTGNALLANFFIDAMNAQLNLGIEKVELTAVHAADPYSPRALRAAGLSCLGN
jgi:hypothetical protein